MVDTLSPGSWQCSTVVTAGGLGHRLGEDKALVRIGELTAIERVVQAHRRAGATRVIVVRRNDAAELPEGLAAEVVRTEPPEMIDSLRAGLRALGDRDLTPWIFVHPIDYPLATDAALRPLTSTCRGVSTETRLVLPRCGDRVGHPIAMHRDIVAEVLSPATLSMREVIRRDPGRVSAVDVDEPWILRDIDEPADLHSARAYLDRPECPMTLAMRAHRSRRSYLDIAVPDAQLDWVVDSARHCSTSSFMQAYSVVAVRDRDRKVEVAKLCADQRHIHEAPLFLAVCADLRRIDASCTRHGGSFQADSLEVFVTATVDAALFGQNIQLAAESEGLGACMIGAARNHPVELAKALGLPRHVYVVFGMTLGFAEDDPVPRGRLPSGAILHREQYDTSRCGADLDAADDSMRVWARRTNAERGGYGGKPVNEQRGWSDRMARLWGTVDPPKGRADLAAELRQLGFGLDLPPVPRGDAT